jgi:hypothetical protein
MTRLNRPPNGRTLVALLVAGSLGMATGCDPDRDPDDPIWLLDTYGGPSFAELLEVTVIGDRVAFCSAVQGMNLYDAADPEALKKLDSIGFAAGSSEYPRCQHVVADPTGLRLYVSSHADQIQPTPFVAVVDAIDPKKLAVVAEYTFDEQVEGLAVVGDLLLVTAHGDGLLVFRRDPGGTLTEIGRVAGLTNAWAVEARGDLAYVADGEGGLAVIDLADPTEPELVTTLELPGTAKDLVLRGPRVYLALGAAGIGALSLGDPRAPTLLTTVDTPGSALAVAVGEGANALYVADWNDIRVFDLSDPDTLTLVGREPLPLDSTVDSRTLGIAGHDDVIFSANWTELVSYRYRPGIRAPDLVVSPATLSLPTTAPGAEGLGIFTLSNDGQATLNISAVDHNDQLSLGDVPTQLEAGQRTNLLVTFAPVNDDRFSSAVIFHSDDPDQAAQAIGVNANGSGLGVGDPVPDWQWTTLDGDVMRISDLDDTPLLLAYFSTF